MTQDNHIQQPEQPADATQAIRQDVAAAHLDPRAFAALGEGQLAYVKPMLSDDIRRLFPQAPDLAPGLELFALLSASGTPILLTDSRETALANAWAHDLRTVGLN